MGVGRQTEVQRRGRQGQRQVSQAPHRPRRSAPEGSLPPTDPKLLLEFLDESAICTTSFLSKPANWVIRDRELHIAMYQAYNDWVLEENAVAPNRLIGLPTLPTTFPEDCVAEVQRLARNGVQTVEFGHLHAGAPLYDPCWEPVWQTLEDEDMLFCCHAGPQAGFKVPPADRGLAAAYFGAQPMEAATPLGQLVISASSSAIRAYGSSGPSHASAGFRSSCTGSISRSTSASWTQQPGSA